MPPLSVLDLASPCIFANPYTSRELTSSVHLELKKFEYLGEFYTSQGSFDYLPIPSLELVTIE